MSDLVSIPSHVPSKLQLGKRGGSSKKHVHYVASILESLAEIAESHGVAAVKTLIKQKALAGATCLLAEGLVERLDSLWECALQLGPILERAAREEVRGYKKKDTDTSKGVRVCVPRCDGKTLMPSLDDGLGPHKEYALFEYVEAIEADLTVVSATLDRLLSANANLEAAMLGAERAGVPEADRMEATANSSQDPIGTAENLSRLEAVAMRRSGLRQAALDESAAARRWLTYLSSFAGEKGWKSAPLPFLEEWLTFIERGPTAEGRWATVLTGLAAWGSLARRVEGVLHEGDKT